MRDDPGSSRIALVTGGGSGIGRAICQRLARDGLSVAVLDVDLAGAQTTADQINTGGGRACMVEADVSDAAQVSSAVERVRAQLGPVTVLVNNAAVDEFAAFQEISEASWNRHMDINLKGVYLVTRAVLPDMQAAGWGRIVNISSMAAQVGAGHMSHYSASKGGVVSLTRSLAQEFGPQGITVNSIAPGFIDTPMARRAIDGDKFAVPYEQIIASYPIPRLGQAEDVATACAFFASDEAGYITAQLLGVNGGATV